MTAATLVAGLMPIILREGTCARSHGTASQRRCFGGVLGAAVLALAVVPALFLLWHRRVGAVSSVG